MLWFQLRSQGSVVQDLPVSGVVLLPEMRRLLRVVFRLISSLKLAADFFFSLLLHAALLPSMRGIYALVRMKSSAAKYLFFFQGITAGAREEATKLVFSTMRPHPNPSPEGRGVSPLLTCRTGFQRCARKSVHLRGAVRGRVLRFRSEAR